MDEAGHSPPRGGERIIVALDTPEPATALAWADAVREEVSLVKVGSTLFSGAGPSVVGELRARGLRVFLDLKLHDIPRTVEETVAVLGGLGVEMTTVHAGGGRAMLQAAKRGRDRTAAGGRLRLLAVTVLTSLDAAALSEVGVAHEPEPQAVRLADLAARCGLDGAVCSPVEVARVRSAAPPGFLLVTPGIRPPGGPSHDQARVAGPAEAIRRGADFVVVGRPVTGAPDPRDAVRRLVASLDPEGP